MMEAKTVEASLAQLQQDPANNPIDLIECLETALVFINNLIDAPGDSRYQRVRLSNINFQERFGHLRHSIKLLVAIGFAPDPIDHEFISISTGQADLVLKMRQARLAIIGVKKQHQERFREISRLSDDHIWNSVRAASCYELQGRRPHMEDDYLLLDEFSGDTTSALFCCYDGHGGRNAVEFCVRSFHINLERSLAQADQSMEGKIADAFLMTDAQMRRRSILESGATAAICLIRMEGEERILYSANVGDARAVLVKYTQKKTTEAVRLSNDHKPSLPAEIERVKQAGGFITGGRVSGILAVSRALGDHHLKPFVSAMPFISRTVLTEDDVAIIIACDGVWDVLSDQAAATFLMEMPILDENESDNERGRRAAQELAAHAFQKGSQDNITAIVVLL